MNPEEKARFEAMMRDSPAARRAMNDMAEQLRRTANAMRPFPRAGVVRASRSYDDHGETVHVITTLEAP